MKPILITKCKCGHISTKFINNAWNTMTEKTFTKHFGILKNPIETFQCDGCINNWTIENGKFKLKTKKEFISWKH